MAFKSFPKITKYFSVTTISTSLVLPSTGVFPVIFILYLIDSESIKLSFAHLCNIVMFLTNYHYILSNSTLALLYLIFRIIYFCIIYFTFTFNNWRTMFKYCTSFYFIYLSCCIISSCSSNYCSSSKKYLCITIIT